MVCTNVTSHLRISNIDIEQVMEGKDHQKETKEEKKEWKEFHLLNHKNLMCSNSAKTYYNSHHSIFLPHPFLNKHIPPPDISC